MEQFFNWVMQGYPARWYCGSWSELVGWSYILGNILTFTAYITIPVVILYVLKKKPNIPIPSVGYLFAAFILSCGITHLVDSIIFWYPIYPIQAGLLVTTGLISWATVWAIKRDFGKILELPEQHAQLISETDKEREIYSAKLEASNKRLHQLLYAASHDLKEPARNIRGYLHLVDFKSIDMSEEKQSYAREIENSATKIYEMLDDLLVFSLLEREDSGQTLVNIKELLESLCQEIGNAEIELGPLPLLTINEFHITQIFKNLIKNADKYRKPGSLLKLKIDSLEKDDSYVFTVADNGIGIPENRFLDIFKLFKQVDPKNPGNGMGLTLVKEIVESYRGNIWLESEPEQGTTFFIELKKDRNDTPKDN